MKKIYLIDGNNFIYRMFFAIPDFATREGAKVNALFGMAKFFTQTLKSLEPQYVVFIKDASSKNFRHEIYSEYKATRDRMPDDLRSQIPLIDEMIKLMNINVIEMEGYEADDIIGTLVNNYRDDYEIEILTGDKDLYSLVSPNVRIFDMMKRKRFGINETLEKFGVGASSVVDYLSIVGDSSDNIPGVPGFGPVKAQILINELGSVEKIYEEVDKLESNGEEIFKNYSKELQKIFSGNLLNKLIEGRESAFLSKKLATIKCDVDLEGFQINNYKYDEKQILNDNVVDFFKKYEFNSLIGDENEIKMNKWSDFKKKVNIVDDIGKLEEELDNMVSDVVVIDILSTDSDIMKREIVGISILLPSSDSGETNKYYYINRLHSGDRVNDDDLREFLKRLLDRDILLIGHNIKYDLEVIDMFIKNNSLSLNMSDGVPTQTKLTLF